VAPGAIASYLPLAELAPEDDFISPEVGPMSSRVNGTPVFPRANEGNSPD